MGSGLTKIFNLMLLHQTSNEKKALSNILEHILKKKNKFNLDLKVYKENYFNKEQMF